MVQKFVCRNPSCERRIFTERLSDLVAAYARHTTQLVTVLQALGVALGWRAACGYQPVHPPCSAWCG
jgi:hypothetical protein